MNAGERDLFMELTIRGYTMSLPVCKSKVNSVELVRQLEARLSRIEDESNKVDSLAFALQAAYELTVELEEEREARQSEIEEIELKLERLLQMFDKVFSSGENTFSVLRTAGNETGIVSYP